MSHESWLELFAWTVVVSTLFIVVVDLGAEFNSKIALYVWGSILYHTIRYIAIGCAIALALDVIN